MSRSANVSTRTGGLIMALVPILRFAWHDAKPAEVRDASVGDIAHIASERAPHAFVLYDYARRYSAVLVPEAVEEAIAQRDASPSDSLVDSGLLDVLTEGQVMVNAEEPAAIVARRALENDSVIVTLVGGSAEPLGVFVPSTVEARLQQTLRSRGFDPTRWFGPQWLERNLDDVSTLAARPDDGLIAAIEAIGSGQVERDYLDFHTENLNHHNPVIGVCPDHGISHITHLPCHLHGSVQSMARTVQLR